LIGILIEMTGIGQRSRGTTAGDIGDGQRIQQGELSDFDPATSGRLPMVIEAAKKLKALWPDAVV
jgi:hypothetical protein